MIFRRICLNTNETSALQKQSLTLSIFGRADYFTAPTITFNIAWHIFYPFLHRRWKQWLKLPRNTERGKVTHLTSDSTNQATELQKYYWAYSRQLHLRVWKILLKDLTPLKLALMSSWPNEFLMILQVEAAWAALHAESLRVLLRCILTSVKFAWSLSVPSCKTSTETLTFSRASFVSLMAAKMWNFLKKHFC